MAKVDAFDWNGKRYARDGFRALPRERMRAARDDPTSPFRDSKHPDHEAAVQDMFNANRWLAGEVGEDEEQEMAIAVNAIIRGETEVPTNEQRPEIQAVREMNQIASTREGKEALQRAATGQDLTPSQAELVRHYKELETAYNRIGYEQRAYSGGSFKTSRPHRVPSELHRIEKILDDRERAHAIRELKSQWRDDPRSAFNDIKNPEHHNYVQAMQRLYVAESELPQPEDAQE